MPGKITLDVGIKIDQREIRSEFTSMSQALGHIGDNVNISDELKKQIAEMMSEIEKLQKEYTKVSQGKHNTSSFEKEKASILEQINAIEQRTTTLETAMRSFISTLSGAEASGFSAWIADLRSSMDNLKTSTTETFEAVSKVTSSLGGNSKFHLVDSVEAQAAQLREALETFEKIESLEFPEGAKFDGGDLYDGLDKATEAIENYISVKKKLSKEDQSSPIFASLQKELADSAYKVQSLFEELRNTFGDSILDESVFKKKSGGYFSIGEYFEKVESEAKQYAESINSQLEQIGNVETKKPNTIAIDFDVQQSTTGLTAKLKRAINATQKYADSNPIEVEINLITKWEKQTKKYSDAFEKMQKNINEIQDEETRSNFQGVLDEIGKGWGKEIAFNLKSSLSETEADLKATIERTSALLSKQKFSINPEIKFEEDAVVKAQETLNNVAGFNVDNIEKYAKTVKEIVTDFKQLSDSGFKLDFGDISSVVTDVERISASLTELLDLYKYGFSKTKLTDLLKQFDADTIDISKFKEIFGSADISQLMFADKMRPQDSTSASYYSDWAQNIIEATNRAGLAVDEYVAKQKELNTSSIEIGGEDFDKLVNNTTTLKNSLNSLRQEADLDAIIAPLKSLEATLLEFSEVVQKSTGILSASNLDKQFEEIRQSAQKLDGIKLNTKLGKEAANSILSQYEAYVKSGGIRDISDLTTAKNLQKYLGKHLGEAESAAEAEKEAASLREVESAADIAASAKERFARANSELLQSIVSSVSGIDNEGKAFQNLNKLLNTLGGSKGGDKLEKTIEGLNKIKELLSTPVGADAFVKSLENLTTSGDALKDLATVIRASKKQIEEATVIADGGDLKVSSEEAEQLNKIKQGFSELSREASKYYELQEKVVSNSATTHEEALLERLDSKYNDLIADVQRFNNEFSENTSAQRSMDQYLKGISKSYDEYIRKFQESTQGKIDRAILTRGNQRNDYTSAFKEEINNAEKLMGELNEIRAKYKPGEIWDVSDLQRVNTIFKEINNTVKGLSDNTKILAKTEDVDKLISKLSKDLNDNTLSGNLKGRYQDLIDYLSQVRYASGDAENAVSQIDRVTLGNIKGEFQALHAEMERTGQTGKGFFKQFTSAITSKSAQFLAQYFSLQDFIRYGRELGQTVTEINSAQTELRKVSDASQTRIAENFKTSAETAKELGATITDVISSTADWARLSLNGLRSATGKLVA